MRTRKPMNKPTKNQLSAAVSHYEESLKSLIDTLHENFSSQDEDGEEEGVVDVDMIVEDLKQVLENAPSLIPVTAPVAEKTQSEEEIPATE